MKNELGLSSEDNTPEAVPIDRYRLDVKGALGFMNNKPDNISVLNERIVSWDKNCISVWMNESKTILLNSNCSEKNIIFTYWLATCLWYAVCLKLDNWEIHWILWHYDVLNMLKSKRDFLNNLTDFKPKRVISISSFAILPSHNRKIFKYMEIEWLLKKVFKDIDTSHMDIEYPQGSIREWSWQLMLIWSHQQNPIVSCSMSNLYCRVFKDEDKVLFYRLGKEIQA